MTYQSPITRLMGSVGIVVEPIPGSMHGAGVVKVSGELWTAQTEWPDTIPAGHSVLIMGRDGVRLVVLPERG